MFLLKIFFFYLKICFYLNRLIIKLLNTKQQEKFRLMNMQLVRNYFSLLIVIYFTNFSQAGQSKQECLHSCLNLLKQIKQLKNLNHLGVLEGRPDLIVKETKYILSKLDEFYKEVYNGQEPLNFLKDLSIDFYESDGEVTVRPVLNNNEINANLFHELESITLKTKELIQRMNEIKCPKHAHLIVTTGSELQG